MKCLLVVLSLILLSAPALAEKGPLIDGDACQYLVNHQPQPDVEYTPGVDVHGKPVVSADVVLPANIKPEKKIYVTADLAEYMGLNYPSGFEGTLKVGVLAVEEDSLQVTFNGEPIGDQAEAQLRILCKEQQKEDQKPASE